MSLLSRYLDGEHELVWNEIRQLTNAEAQENRDVLGVASATMERVAQNADLLTKRLKTLGWEPLDLGYSSLRTPPSHEDQLLIDRIVEISGHSLPVSFEAFWNIVGGINWIWNYESKVECPDLGLGLSIDEMDPLCVSSPQFVAYQIGEWDSGEHHFVTGLQHDQYRLDLAPDYLHKANISGGDAYAIYLPAKNPDPTFAHERHELPFFDYLRLAFRWGGFPRLEEHAQKSDVQIFVNEFTSGLIKF
ncbi:hypothetical protein PUV54_11270 [Hyphococcus flavus]|uniref:Uncharacterized protein n=1 Tax=Hyphococcus flavus TaxID=1866326 RepID=A0AAF0CE23_9PROT|nr:hypothetical protein [Hyphococcus flavus]WDI30536.1 hypothetical protein PUV54_11270 [Hyphococcus flavus]